MKGVIEAFQGHSPVKTSLLRLQVVSQYQCYSLSACRNPMETTKDDNMRATEFKLERYKYILQQLNLLNDNHHNNLTLFQTLSMAVLGAGVGLFVAWRELKIDAETARVGLRGLFGLFDSGSISYSEPICKCDVLDGLPKRRGGPC